MAETKMNKTRHCTGRLRASIRLKCNFIFTIKNFFHPLSNLPHQSFLGSIRPKRDDKKIVNESSKVSRLRDLERKISTATPAAFNITQTRLILLTLMEVAWLENPHPIYIPLFQRRRFSYTDILIFTNTIVWTFCFLFVNIIIKFFNCLLVWFATLCFVLSLQPYAWYNIIQ